MPGQPPALWRLMQTIASGDVSEALQMLHSTPSLASAGLTPGASRQHAPDFFLATIGHYAYAGDTALHIASAAYQLDTVKVLLDAGAAVNARNRRGAEPLHYAADGLPGSASWNPAAQAATIAYLIAAGADPNAADGSKVRPLHRAVRTRCARAVQALLEGGAEPSLPNKNGSTPLQLATRPTGRGGAGSDEARAEQAEIIRLLESALG